MDMSLPGLARLHRRRLLTAAATTAALGVTGRRARAADEIIVGATVPITGPLAGSGLQYYDALQMAQDDINKTGINGKKLKIIFEDTQASNSVAVNAFIKLAQQDDPVFIFLSSYTIQNLAVLPQVTKAQIPCVYAGGGLGLTPQPNPYMFRIRPPDNIAAKAMAAGVVDMVKIKEAGIIHIADDYGTGSAHLLEAALKAAGANVVAMESYNGRDNDFSAQLLSLKNKGAKVLVAFSYIRDGALVLTQRRTLGLDMPMVASSSFTGPALLDLVTPADLTGLISVIDAVIGSSVSPASTAYATAFKDRFKMNADPYGSCYYDAAMILADGLRKVGPDRAKIRDYFAGVKDYHGVTRVYSTDKLGDMAHSVALVDYVPGTKTMHLLENFQAT